MARDIQRTDDWKRLLKRTLDRVADPADEGDLLSRLGPVWRAWSCWKMH